VGVLARLPVPLRVRVRATVEVELEVKPSEDNGKPLGVLKIGSKIPLVTSHDFTSYHATAVLALDGPVKYGPEVMIRRVDATLALLLG
jgi:hypothetical protein